MRRLTILLVFWLSACQLLPRSNMVYQLDGGHYRLQTHWPGPAQQILQQVVFTTAGQHHEFLLSAQLDAQQMLLVGLSPLGQELWRIELTSDGQLLTAGIQPFADKRFAVQLLAQMQWSLLPLPDIQPQLRALTLTDMPNQRQVKNADGQTVLTIEGAGEIAVGKTYRIFDGNFELSIVTLERELL
ncbi:MAG: DUF3261 domain-containing protein [Rheinheimera sp.]|nr:MAG: DUF3261 domain-containing protein [Rheinheimera sp.]